MICVLKLFLFFSFFYVTSARAAISESKEQLTHTDGREVAKQHERSSREQFLSEQRKYYYQERHYHPLEPLTLDTFENHSVEIEDFLAKHKYQSPHRPLVGIVTKDPDDLSYVNQLLVRLQKQIKNQKHLRLLADEILAKIIAYRELEIGQKIYFPVHNKKGKAKIVIYKVEKKFSLLGMPAFGLTPNKKDVAPIVLFRGTDLSASIKGYSSVVADLDLNGPGLTAFYAGQESLHEWLLKLRKKYPSARAVGYSLGGALVQYACIFEKELLSKNKRFPSVAFNQPGVSEDLVFKWNNIAPQDKPILKGYITEGDLVSIVGKLIGSVRALTLDYPLEPLNAHVTLMSAQHRVYSYKLDVTLKDGSN